MKMFQEIKREIDENKIINKIFLSYYETEFQHPEKNNIKIYSF